jgi:hypothetical protein
VSQIGHADLHLRPRQADGAHEQRHAVLLRSKDMLDAGADPRTRGIGLGLLLGKPAPRWLAELDPLRQAAPLQHFQVALGAVGGVGPDAAGGVPGIQQNWKAAAVVLSGIGDRPPADQSMPPVDADMALVAEDRHRDRDGLALRAL